MPTFAPLNAPLSNAITDDKSLPKVEQGKQVSVGCELKLIKLADKSSNSRSSV